MKCPYCAEEIQSAAIVCRHCQRDLWLLRPLMEEVDTLRQRVSSLDRPAPDPASDNAALAINPAAHRLRWDAAAITVAALVVAHVVVVLALDWPLLALRIVSIAIPLAGGFMFRAARRPSPWWDVAASLLVSAAALLGMLAAVSLVDGVPLLPQTRPEWQEATEYGISMALAFWAGALARRCVMLVQEPGENPGGPVRAAVGALAREVRGDKERNPIDKQIKIVEAIVTTAVTVCVALASIVAGVSKLMN